MKRLAFTKARKYANQEYDLEEHKKDKQRHILHRVMVITIRRLDKAYFILTYNSLGAKLREKQHIMFVLNKLKNQEFLKVVDTYNILKERKLLMEGMAAGLKMQFLKRMLENGSNVLHLAMYKLQENCKIERLREERISKLTEDALKMMIDTNYRLMRPAF